MANQTDITYPNALASNGKIVNVGDPEFQDRSLTFTCLGCGEPMVAVHREKGQPHFRHKNSNPNCNPQTYLHILAKKEYKRMFDSGNHFIVEYRSERICHYRNVCVFREGNDICQKEGYDRIDLHSLYDTCEEEVGYKGFKGDLVLTNSKEPDQEPLFLEIAVTHKCNEEKIKSGIPIIEIDVQEESDIRLPLSEKGRADTKPVTIYSFNRNVVSKEVYDTRRIVRLSIQDQSRTVAWDWSNPWKREVGTCREMIQPNPYNTLFELFIKKSAADSLSNEELMKLTYSYMAVFKHKYVRFCMFCNKYRHIDQDTGKLGDIFCKSAKKNLLKDAKCPGFEYEEECAKEIIRQYRDIPALSR